MISYLILLLVALSSIAQGQTPAQRSMANDLTTLNYALTLENLENVFYQMGLSRFTSAQFVAAGFNASVRSYLELVSAHEASHVAFLTAAINAVVPGAAVPNCTYNFSASMSSVNAFIATAAVLENAGQTAYDGALNRLSNQAFAQVAAQIATVEARHAAYLNGLVGVSSFPNAIDVANLPSTIAEAITPFLVSCPYNISLPSVRPEGVALNAEGQPIVTGSIVSATYTAAQRANDLNILNYALTLERFEAAFYSYIFGRFNQSAFTAAGFPAGFYNQTQMIGMHENVHVSTIETVINQRVPGAAVPACVYNFSSITSLTGPNGFLAVARLLEETGTRAYLGVANAVTDTNLQQVAASITTVEARHVAYLNNVLGLTPFPLDQDVSQSPSQTLEAVFSTGLVVSCPYTPVLPQLLPFSLSVSDTGVRGDPAFVGFHQQAFQVHGIPDRHFSILSTPNLQASATFIMIQDGEARTAGQMKQIRLLREIRTASKQRTSVMSLPITTAFSHAGTFLGQVAIQLSGAKLFAVAGDYEDGIAKITLNDKPLAVSSSAVEVAPKCFITHSHSHIITVDTELLSFTLVNSDKFFNIEHSILNLPYMDDMQIDGLLGQTANPQWKVENTKEFKNHMVYDYLIAGDDIFSTDTVTNLYKPASE